MRGKITKRTVDAAKPERSDVFLWDTKIKGFGLKVTPAGNKVYVLQYRKGGRGTPTKRVTIGRHGTLTPEQARVMAGRMAGAIKNDADPAAARAKEKVAPTITTFAARFLAEHVATKNKPRTAAEYTRLIEKIILPALGHHRVRDVTQADVTRLHYKFRAVPYEANRVLAVLSKMMNLAEKLGERPDGSNPCRHVERYGERKRERFLSEAEAARLGNVLATAEKDGSESPYVVAAIRLLALSGARLDEILTLRWEHVDFERACLRLPKHKTSAKTGTKTIPLNAPALALLDTLPRIEGNSYVIPGMKAGAHLVNLQKPWRRIRARAAVALWRASDDPAITDLVAGLTAELGRAPTAAECLAAAKQAKIELPTALLTTRLNDLRHSFASFGAGAGLSLPVIGALLGHTQAATTQRYAHLAANPLKQASDLIGGRIAAAMGNGKGQAADVVPMKRQR